MSVRTNRHTFLGRYAADSTGEGFTARYDPDPLPPVYPGQSGSELGLSPKDEIRVMGEHHADFRWPVELAGAYRRDGAKLVINVRRGATNVEWVLIRYNRPKW